MGFRRYRETGRLIHGGPHRRVVASWAMMPIEMEAIILLGNPAKD